MNTKDNDPDRISVKDQELLTIFEFISEGVFYQKAGGEITWWNKAAERLFGLTATEAKGLTSLNHDWRMVHENGNDCPGEEHPSMITLRTGRALNEQVLGIKRDDGSITWLSISTSPVYRDNEDLPHAVIVSFSDITKRKQAEEALVQSEQMHRLLFENTDALISLYDRDGFCMMMNNKVAELFGGVPEDFMGRNFAELHPPAAEEYTKRIREVIDSGEPRTYEDKVLFPEGERWLLSNVYPSRDAQGKISAAQIMSQDITERKLTEEALGKSERLFRKVFEILPIGLWIADNHGHLLAGNPAGVRIWGGSPLVDQSKYGVFKARRLPSGEEIAPDDWALAHTVNKGVTIADELLEIDAFDNVTRTILNYTAPVMDDEGNIQAAIIVNQDVSERVKAEKEKDELEVRLRQSQKMEAVGTLAGGIAHDFNNILAAILGYAGLVADDLPNDHPALPNTRQLIKAVKRAIDLVRQILAFSRPSDQTRKPLNITPLIYDALSMMRATLPTTLQVKHQVHVDNDLVMADATQINQVLVNLVTNAAQSMDEKGVISVELSEIEIKGPRAHLELNPGAYLRLKVTDTGRGMDAGTMERVFEPFFTTRGVGEGTGMGLSVVHGIVTSHGGAVTVESQPDKGSAFHVYLPLLGMGASSHPAPDTYVAVGGSEKVLVVDDEFMVVHVTSKALTRLGYSVDGYTSGPEALAAFRKDPDGYKVVITDYTMPEMTGAELARAMLEIKPDMPIILCTGYSDRISEDRALEMGIARFAYKPVDRSEMALMLRELLEPGGDGPE